MAEKANAPSASVAGPEHEQVGGAGASFEPRSTQPSTGSAPAHGTGLLQCPAYADSHAFDTNDGSAARTVPAFTTLIINWVLVDLKLCTWLGTKEL